MKAEVIKGLVLAFVLSIMTTCNTRKEEAVVIDKEQVKKEIQAKEDEFAALYNAGEIKHIGYYADEATSFLQNTPPLVGKTAIIEYMKTRLDTLSNDRKISFTTNEVFVSNDGEQVVEVGYFKVVDKDGNIANSGNYMSLFVKRDGKYFSLRDMSTSDIPVE
jgi:ketosteroid isomerase-like protein